MTRPDLKLDREQIELILKPADFKLLASSEPASMAPRS